jgi:3-oxoacyl-[acyl-carrier protein] reductase
MNSEGCKHTAIVIGGSGQIGRAIVDNFIRAGCRVAVVARGRTKISWPDKEDQVLTVRADVGNERQVHEVFRHVKEAFGEINFLVYAAAIDPDPDNPIAEYSLTSWEETYRTYVTGVFICMKEALHHLEPGGHFVVLSSAVTRFQEKSLPPLYIGHYASAKAALNELCKWVRREFHARGLLLSRIAPAAVDVPYHRNAPPHRKPAKLIPLDSIASKIVHASLNSVEVDEDIF